jgi:hypothetical protein
MMVKITLAFDSVDQAIVALGKLVGTPAAKPASDKPARKPRNDAGQPRGPHASRAAPEKAPTIPVVASATAQPAAENGGNVQSAVPDPSKATDKAANSTSTPAPAPKGAEPAPATNATPGTTLEQAQAAMEKVYKAKGVDTAKQILARLGTNRVKDIKPEALGQFVKMATDIAAFPEEQNTPAFATKLQAYFAQ